MHPISSSPIKASTSSTQDRLTLHATKASTSSATVNSAAASTSRGCRIDTDLITIPKQRLRSTSPEKRDFFLRQQMPAAVSPSKPVYNSEFTGRTFSEREQALRDKANGLAVKPLPERKINEVPWLNQGKGGLWQHDWEIAEDLATAEKLGRNIRKLTDEEKALLSPARAKATMTRPPFVQLTPLELQPVKPAAPSTFKGPTKETQTVIGTSTHGSIGEPRACNTQGTTYREAQTPIKVPSTQETSAQTFVHRPLSAINASSSSSSDIDFLQQGTRHNAQQIPASTSAGAINSAKIANTSRHCAAPKTNVDSTQQTLSGAPTRMSTRLSSSMAQTDSCCGSDTSYSDGSPSMTRTTSDSGSHATSCTDTEGTASTVCVPNPLPQDLTRYELIIWRNFARTMDARGNDITPKTRKVSFPITQEFATRIAAGQNLTFVNNFNTLLEGAQDELALLLPLTIGSDGIHFPPEFVEIAEKQFTDIVGELVRFQKRGYGRWSVDSLRRRVVIDDATAASSVTPHLEAVIVIRLTGFTKKGWLGLPGYDANGDLRPTSPGTLTPNNDESSGPSNSGQPDIDPRSTTPSGGVEGSSELPSVQLRSKGNRSECLPEAKTESSNAVDEAMSMSLSKNVQEMFYKHLLPRTIPISTMQTPNPRGHSAEIRLSASTTPFLPPKSGQRNTQGTIGDGTGMAAWNNYAGEAPDPRVKHLATSTRASQLQFRTPAANEKKNDDLDATPKPKRVTSEDLCVASGGGRIDTRQPDTAESVIFGQKALAKAQPEAGKTYVSTRNPSNPIPGALLSPGVIDSEPTLRMVLPTPPAKSTTTTKLVINPSNISQHADEKTATRRNKADFFGALFPAKSTSSFVASNAPAGTGTMRPQNLPPVNLVSNVESRRLATPSQSSQVSSNSGAPETGSFRRRWEFAHATTASLAKERPPSPLKTRAESPVRAKEHQTISRAGSPVKRSDTPVKSNTVPKEFAAAQPTAASVARAASTIKSGATQISGNAASAAIATARPKSRTVGTEGTAKPRSRAGSATRGTGTLSRYGTVNVRF